MGIFDKPPRYRSYLLTFWEERSRDPDPSVVWRFRLEDPRTGKRRGFTGLEEVMANARLIPSIQEWMNAPVVAKDRDIITYLVFAQISGTLLQISTKFSAAFSSAGAILTLWRAIFHPGRVILQVTVVDDR
jgi:hypothetical protein